MKKLLANLAINSFLVVSWATLLTFLGVWYFRRYSVVPTFPYYYTLLSYVKDAAFALWGYFDGVHYLRLISSGYQDLGSQAFFPLYPLLVRGISEVARLSPYLSGILLSLGSLIGALTTLSYLYPTKKYYYILSLLLFPTSFFFVGLYTESLFLLLSVIFFLLLRNKQYFLAAIIAGFASSTRLVGVFLSIALLAQLLQPLPNKITLKQYFTYLLLFLLSTSGFLIYIIFLWTKFNDPLMFLHVQSMFGAERSGSEIILLPQVIFRYLRMIITVDPSTFIYQRIWLELVSFIIASFAWLYNLKHLPKSISIYVGLSLLLPTLTGTLSSFPRYVLVLLPFLLPSNMSKSRYYLLNIVFLSLLIYLFKNYSYGTFIS